jgi:hypothetical protein
MVWCGGCVGVSGCAILGYLMQVNCMPALLQYSLIDSLEEAAVAVFLLLLRAVSLCTGDADL